MDFVCEVCGNLIEQAGLVCPYCGYRKEEDQTCKNKGFSHITINLEAGRPLAEAAINRMVAGIEDAARNGADIVTLIHGYGSSGKGGVIRSECRKMLDYMKNKGQIGDYIKGEEFSVRSGKVKFLLQRYPRLRTDKNLNRKNRGITQVILASQ